MSETILITGATGEVGARVITSLAGRGARVRAGVRDVAKAQDRWGAKVEVVPFDFTDAALVSAALRDVERVLLITPPPSILPNELNLAEPIITAAAQGGIKHFVRLSSMWALHKPESAHRVIEQAIEASGIPYTHLRPNIFMQNFTVSQRQQIRAQHSLFVSAGAGKVSFIDVRDIAEVAAHVLTSDGHDGQAYTLTGPQALGYDEVAATLSRVTGQPIRYLDLSDAALETMLRDQGWPVDLNQYVRELYAVVRAGKRAQVAPDVEQLLGRAPRDFATFAQEHAALWGA